MAVYITLVRIFRQFLLL